jgi:mRNA interferase MazF
VVISQGEVFWVDLAVPAGSEPGFPRPVVVIQNDIFNRSGLNTVVVCAITSNLHVATAPGNVLLAKGEANLPRRSVANVTQVLTLNKSDLIEKIGTLSHERVTQIISGIALMLAPQWE